MSQLASPSLLLALTLSICPAFSQETPKAETPTAVAKPQRHSDASAFGFSPDATGMENTAALQKALDQGGTITVNQPGTYLIGYTVFIGSHTSLVCGNGVFFKKSAEKAAFCHVILNKGALTKTYDENIVIDGLQILVNGVDANRFLVYGLRGQLAFFYVKDLKIRRFRCPDLGSAQFCIHICTFEDILIEDVNITGNKDGIHLGRGKRFTIRDGVFKTFDDAIALNAHDYSSSNPELGWIEDGIIENCHDLDQENTTGYFCRILAGGWIDWKKGMEVQQSDTVVCNGALYRVQAKADGTKFISNTQPSHKEGSKVLDGITWGHVQNDITYTAGVRNVTFRDIFLSKPRTGFSIHFDNDKYSRSYYPGADIPQQENLAFDNVRTIHKGTNDLLSIGTPVDVVSITNSTFRNNRINVHGNRAMEDYLPTKINLVGCSFLGDGKLELVKNSVPGKLIALKTTASTVLSDKFSATVAPNTGKITVDSDLPGLKK